MCFATVWEILLPLTKSFFSCSCCKCCYIISSDQSFKKSFSFIRELQISVSSCRTQISSSFVYSDLFKWIETVLWSIHSPSFYVVTSNMPLVFIFEKIPYILPYERYDRCDIAYFFVKITGLKRTY